MEGIDSKGSIYRIRECTFDFLSMEDDLIDDEDEDSWELMERDLNLKSTFLYCDLNRIISSAHGGCKGTLAELANKLFCCMQERYDLDPAAKAAAASVLASKLGADSCLKVSLGDEFNAKPSSARSNDVELVQSSGLWSRRQSHSHGNNNGSSGTSQSVTKMSNESAPDAQFIASQSQMVVEHHRGPCPSDGGWIGCIAALLVRGDSSQSYALICGNCLRHNGLARREDFARITYYCPHCHALNTSSTSSGISSSAASADGTTLLRNLSNASSTSTTTGSEVTSNTAVATAIHELPLGAAEGDLGD